MENQFTSLVVLDSFCSLMLFPTWSWFASTLQKVCRTKGIEIELCSQRWAMHDVYEGEWWSYAVYTV